MAHFIRLTPFTDKSGGIIVNLDMVSTMLQKANRTRICFAGSEEDYAEVVESVDDIVKIAGIE